MSEKQDNIIVTTPDDIGNPVETKENQDGKGNDKNSDAEENNNSKDENDGEDSETSDNENDDDESDQDDEKDDDDESDQDDEAEIKPKKRQNGFKKRLNRAKRQINAAKEEAEYWRKQALKQENRSSNNESDDVKPQKTTGRPIADDFETQEDYLEALTDYKVEQKLRVQKEEMTQNQEKQRQLKIAETWQGRLSEFKNNHPDFEEVMEEAEDVKFHDSVTETILTSDVGPAILYELANDQELADKISKLSPLSGVKEIGKIEAKLSSSSKETKKTNKTTKAPPPIGKKVSGGGKRSSNMDLYDDNLSQKDFEALRERQLAKK